MPTINPKAGMSTTPKPKIRLKKLKKVVMPKKTKKHEVKLKHLKKVHSPKIKSIDKSLRRTEAAIQEEARRELQISKEKKLKASKVKASSKMPKAKLTSKEPSAKSIAKLLAKASAKVDVTAEPGRIRSKANKITKLKSITHVMPSKAVIHHMFKSGTYKHPISTLQTKESVKKRSEGKAKIKSTSSKPSSGRSTTASSKQDLVALLAKVQGQTTKEPSVGKGTPKAPSGVEIARLMKAASSKKISKAKKKPGIKKEAALLAKVLGQIPKKPTVEGTPKVPSTLEISKLLKAASIKKHSKAKKPGTKKPTGLLAETMGPTTKKPTVEGTHNAPSTLEIAKLLKAVSTKKTSKANKPDQLKSAKLKEAPKEPSAQIIAKLLAKASTKASVTPSPGFAKSKVNKIKLTKPKAANFKTPKVAPKELSAKNIAKLLAKASTKTDVTTTPELAKSKVTKVTKLKSVSHVMPSKMVMHSMFKSGTYKHPISTLQIVKKAKKLVPQARKVKTKLESSSLKPSSGKSTTRAPFNQRKAALFANKLTTKEPLSGQPTPNAPSIQEIDKFMKEAESAISESTPEASSTKTPVAKLPKTLTADDIAKLTASNAKGKTTKKALAVKGAPKAPSTEQLAKLMKAAETSVKNLTKVKPKTTSAKKMDRLMKTARTTKKPAKVKPKAPSTIKIAKLLKAANGTTKKPTKAKPKLARQMKEAIGITKTLTNAKPNAPSSVKIAKLLKAAVGTTKKPKTPSSVKIAKQMKAAILTKKIPAKGKLKAPSNIKIAKLMKAAPEVTKKPAKTKPKAPSSIEIAKLMKAAAGTTKKPKVPSSVKIAKQMKVPEKIRPKAKLKAPSTIKIAKLLKAALGTTNKPTKAKPKVPSSIKIAKLMKAAVGSTKKPKAPSSAKITKQMTAAKVTKKIPAKVKLRAPSNIKITKIMKAAKGATRKATKTKPKTPSSIKIAKLMKATMGTTKNPAKAKLKAPPHAKITKIMKASLGARKKPATILANIPSTQYLAKLMKGAKGTNKKHKTPSAPSIAKLLKAAKGTTKQATTAKPKTPSASELDKLMKATKQLPKAKAISKLLKTPIADDLAKMASQTKTQTPFNKQGSVTTKVPTSAELTKLLAKAGGKEAIQSLKTTAKLPSGGKTTSNTPSAEEIAKLMKKAKSTSATKVKITAKKQSITKLLGKASGQITAASITKTTPKSPTAQNIAQLLAKKMSPTKPIPIYAMGTPSSQEIAKLFTKGTLTTTKPLSMANIGKMPLGKHLAKLIKKNAKNSKTLTLGTLAIPTVKTPNDLRGPPSVDQIKEEGLLKNLVAEKNTAAQKAGQKPGLPDMNKLVKQVQHKSKIFSGKKIKKAPNMEKITNIYGLENARLTKKPKLKSKAKIAPASEISKSLLRQLSDDNDGKAKKKAKASPSPKPAADKLKKKENKATKARSMSDLVVDQDLLRQLSGDSTKTPLTKTKGPTSKPDILKKLLTSTKKLASQTKKLNRHTVLGEKLLKKPFDKKDSKHLQIIRKHTVMVDKHIGKAREQMSAVEQLLKQVMKSEGKKTDGTKKSSAVSTNKAKVKIKRLISVKKGAKATGTSKAKKTSVTDLTKLKGSTAKSDILKELMTSTKKLNAHSETLNKHTALGEQLLKKPLGKKDSKHVKIIRKHTVKSGKLIKKHRKHTSTVEKLLKQVTNTAKSKKTSGTTSLLGTKAKGLSTNQLLKIVASNPAAANELLKQGNKEEANKTPAVKLGSLASHLKQKATADENLPVNNDLMKQLISSNKVPKVKSPKLSKKKSQQQNKKSALKKLIIPGGTSKGIVTTKQALKSKWIYVEIDMLIGKSTVLRIAFPESYFSY
jgi:hypothetical protein